MPETLDNGTMFNQSAVKTMRIIELLAKNGNDAMRLNDIAKALNMNTSTVLRFLASLRSLGYIEQNLDTSKYYLTLKLNAMIARIDIISFLREIAHPYLHSLSICFNETVCLGIERDMKVVYIDIVTGPEKMVRSEARIGNSTSMHCTGIGKLLMLNYSDEKIVKWEEHMGFKIYTEHTIKTHDALVSCLKEVRTKGYAFDNEECELNARCVAVPIRDYTGKVIAGISVSGTISHLSETTINKNMAILIDAADKISWQMGYQNDI